VRDRKAADALDDQNRPYPFFEKAGHRDADVTVGLRRGRLAQAKADRG
jgi:hypothetical protein